MPVSSLFLTDAWFDILDRFGLPQPPARREISACEGRLRLRLLQEAHRWRAMSNYYSADFGLIDNHTLDAESAQALASSFRRVGARHIELSPLRPDSPLLHILPAALTAEGFICDRFHVSTNWYLPCGNQNWADYLATRPSRLRNTLRRCQAKLAREAGFAIHIIQGGPELVPALEDYKNVYAQSWKTAEPFPHFIPELCNMVSTHGWLRLGLLYLNHLPVAVQIWFVKDGTASIYKLAYDARVARLGVGTVLTAALFEYAMDVDKVNEIDFLTGEDAYKAEWMSHSRPLQGLVAFDKYALSGLLPASKHFAGRWIRRLRKRT